MAAANARSASGGPCLPRPQGKLAAMELRLGRQVCGKWKKLHVNNGIAQIGLPQSIHLKSICELESGNCDRISFMTHEVDGFEIAYTSRTSWKANIWEKGKLVAVAPVTWRNHCSRDPETKQLRQTVWFQKEAELLEALDSKTPFVVAIAEAYDEAAEVPAFRRFTAIFKVVATGKRLDDKCIETIVLERVRVV